MTSKHSIDRRRLAAAAAITTAFLAAACGGPEATPPERSAAAAVATVVVQPTSIPMMRAVAGMAVSSHVAPLSANVVGSVTRVLVAEGDRVRAGQVLIEIDSREATARTAGARAASAEVGHAIQAARADAALAGSTLRRYAALYARRSVSAQELEEVQARNTAAQAELARLLARRDEASAASDQASAVLAFNFVRSPIDGVVTRRFVDAGAQAAPGIPLIAVEDTSSYRVEAHLPADLRLAPGSAVVLEIAGRKLEGRVSNVQPSVDSVERSSLVKIAPREADPALRSGAYVRVLAPAGQRTALMVPAAAVVRRGHLTSVFVAGSDAIARMRLITLGEDGEVLSGLEAGERVITEPEHISDGVRVE